MGNFPRMLVTDNAGNPLPLAVGKFYALSDTSATTPLNVEDSLGNPLTADEVVANALGITDNVRVPGYVAVSWVSGSNRQDVQAVDIVPAGGAVGDVLAKTSADSYEYSWLPTGLGRDIRTYGAVSGTDSTAAIQACFADGPGGVIIPPGDWWVSDTIEVVNDATFVFGCGAGSRTGSSQPGTGSKLRAIAGLTGPILRFQRTADDRPLQGCHISNLDVDGNNIATVTDGIVFRVNQGSIINTHIWSCLGSGLQVQGYASPYWDTYDTRFTNLLIGYCGDGLELLNNAADLHFTNCIFLNNTNDNCIVTGSSSQFTACHFYTAGRYNIRIDGGGSRAKFANCKIEGNSNHGVFIDSTIAGYSDIQFTGNGFSSLNQSAATNTFDYVHFAGPSGNGIARTLFSGNSFNLKGGSTVKARYAINLSSSAAQNTIITGNAFGVASSWGTAPLNNASNSSLLQYVRSNFGLPDICNINVQTGTTYTFTPLDAEGGVVELNNAAAIAATVPPNAQPGFMKGNQLRVVQTGAGQVTITPGAGVTLRVPAGKTAATRVQWSTITLRQRATNDWVLEGDLA
jgi:hypothetical protein